MATKTYRRGDFVKYEGSIQRFHGTWWTVTAVNQNGTGKVVSYTLHTRGIGKLSRVSPGSINQNRQAA